LMYPCPITGLNQSTLPVATAKSLRADSRIASTVAAIFVGL
jgi:hypothetical protein